MATREYISSNYKSMKERILTMTFSLIHCSLPSDTMEDIPLLNLIIWSLGNAIVGRCVEGPEGGAD
jgi:hypothetical protein